MALCPLLLQCLVSMCDAEQAARHAAAERACVAMRGWLAHQGLVLATDATAQHARWQDWLGLLDDWWHLADPVAAERSRAAGQPLPKSSRHLQRGVR